ncbi:GDNF family receptor alpha-like [Rhinichthys klamathensis goyatoka]|uniref:GDNF family receptor alpha-like n=1 Tax=Rhinichthys klamathensis goyatoka TaxID=3034132 RepID=UPI0024B51153|nr:GDNF family receptor alpha-like [Rhinichthys klamathensis goyatoka]
MKVTKPAFLIACHLLFQLISINTSRTTDCTSHMDACVSKRICRSEQAVLRDVCNYKDGCHTTDARLCNATLQMMSSRSPALGECVCSGPDPCRALQQLYSQCQHRLAQKNKKPETEWKASVHHTSRSCLEETKACLEEESCNRRMVPFVQECNAYQCNLSQCRQATRQFYSALPHDVAERLVFCDCDGEDQECQQMKASLHSGSCASDPSQTPWTCLEALDRCSGDASCRQIFNRYLSKCFGEEDAAHDSPSEWLNLINHDNFIGEDLQCRVAFVETMGSILHHPCTCDGLRHHDEYKCNELKQIFQDKSFFKLSKAKENFRHGESNMKRQPTNEPSADQQWLGGETVQHGQSDDLGKGQQPTNESRVKQQWLSDQLLHLLIYVSALTVVVLLVVSLLLLRLRRIHQAAGKPTFEAHQSKSLTLSSVII